jgi:hypothetical protein
MPDKPRSTVLRRIGLLLIVAGFAAVIWSGHAGFAGISLLGSLLVLAETYVRRSQTSAFKTIAIRALATFAALLFCAYAFRFFFLYDRPVRDQNICLKGEIGYFIIPLDDGGGYEIQRFLGGSSFVFINQEGEDFYFKEHYDFHDSLDKGKTFVHLVASSQADLVRLKAQVLADCKDQPE